MIETIGRYERRSVLGRGAMGTVYEAWDPENHRRVALKTIRLPNIGDDQAAEEYARFKREAQAVRTLTHPGIIEVYDSGEVNDTAYMAMELVEGQSLKSLLDKEHRLPSPTAVRVIRELLSALAYSHRRGVIHRDIKPSNIMLTAAGSVKVIDFGIARIESSDMTQVGEQLGAPAYMSPEQHLGEPVDSRTDIYSAGVVLYELITGERPFQGGEAAVRHKVLHTAPLPPSEISVTAPKALDAVVIKAMARRPEDRFPTAEAFAAAIDKAMAPDLPDTSGADGEATRLLRPSPVVSRDSAQPRRDDASTTVGILPVVFATASVLLLIAAGAAWYLMQERDKPEAGPAVPQQTASTTEAQTPVSPPVAQTPGASVSPPSGSARTESATLPPSASAVPVAPPQATAPPPPPPVSSEPAPPAETAGPLRPANPVQPGFAESTPPAPNLVPPASPPQPLPAPEATHEALNDSQPSPQTTSPRIPTPIDRGSPEQPDAIDQPPRTTTTSKPVNQRLAVLEFVLAKVPCSSIAAKQADQRITLTGFVQAGSPEQDARGKIQTAIGASPGSPVDWNVTVFEGPYCGVTRLLRELRSEADDSGGFGFTLKGDRTRYRLNESFVPVVATPAFAGHLVLAYFQSDRTTTQLFPETSNPDRVFPPASSIQLGSWQVDRPFGNDMILLVASSQKLDFTMPEQSRTDKYLAALQNAIDVARQNGAMVLARAVSLQTQP